MTKTANPLLLGAGVLLIAGWLGWKGVKTQSAELLPIKYVRIESAFQYIAKDTIRQLLRGLVNNGLYNANIQQMQKSMYQLPWIEKVTVKRVWPDAIDIKILEQTPVVRWGKTGLLNNNGELFVPDNMDKFNRLPLIKGPDGYEKKLLEIMQGIEISLAEKNMKLAEFNVNERRAWNIKLSNKIELKIGRNDPLNKVQRFLQTLSLFGSENLAKVKVADLRYPNGYALTWKQGKKNIDWKKLAESKKI